MKKEPNSGSQYMEIYLWKLKGILLKYDTNINPRCTSWEVFINNITLVSTIFVSACTVCIYLCLYLYRQQHHPGSPACALYQDLPPPSSLKITSLDSKTIGFSLGSIQMSLIFGWNYYYYYHCCCCCCCFSYLAQRVLGV